VAMSKEMQIRRYIPGSSGEKLVCRCVFLNIQPRACRKIPFVLLAVENDFPDRINLAR
jgi:hypothetical protein